MSLQHLAPGSDPLRLQALTRRHFFRDCGVGLGKIALAALLTDRLRGRAAAGTGAANPLAPKPPHFSARAGT